MANSSKTSDTRKASSDTRKVKKTDWQKPYPEFPLSYHPPSGRLYKKILGKRHYFGYASDWEKARDKYLREKDDLFAGRTPRVPLFVWVMLSNHGSVKTSPHLTRHGVSSPGRLETFHFAGHGWRVHGDTARRPTWR